MRDHKHDSSREIRSVPEIPTFIVLEDGNTTLAVAEENFNPFNIKRFFTLESKEPDTRGFHAHKICEQTIICVLGTASVICRDGVGVREYRLNQCTPPLIIPAGIWTEIELGSCTKLLVLASEYYEEFDYIRDWDEFIQFRRDS